MNKILIIIILLITGFNQNYSQDKKPEKATPKRLFLAKVDCQQEIVEITKSKVEAAVNLAAKLTGKYSLISNFEVDSVIQSQNRQLSIGETGKFLKADRILFISVSMFKNMLRVELVEKYPQNGKKESRGIGYAILHYRIEESEKVVYDPSLLVAIQRAFASAENLPDMYSEALGSFKVFPASTLVIGGIVYEDDNNPEKWELFTNKTVTSFDAVESIFEQAKDSPNFAVYDTDTRDSIYAMFNMFGVENYRSPNSYEIEALRKFDINYYITGYFKRNAAQAEIELYLCTIKGTSLEIVSTEKGILENDKIEDFRQVLKELTKKLLKM